jgi:cytoskeletal protein RodZ
METANFGTVLREARERRQVSLAEVAQRTKLPTSSLESLEAGKLDELPAEVFVRGFIRSYAQAVGISHGEPLSLFDEAVNERRRGAGPPAPVLPVGSRRRKPAPVEPAADEEGSTPRRGIGLAVFVIIVLLIATITLSLFLRQQPQSGEGLSVNQSTVDGRPSTARS